MFDNKKEALQFFTVLVGIILLALSRVIPHPPNFTPIMAMSLFGGAYFANKKLAFLLPLTVLFISDIFIGFHSLMWAVYLSFAFSIVFGILLKSKINLKNTAFFTFLSSAQFFIITNFSVWLTLGMYPKTLEGLILCYTMGLPYFQNTLLGNFFYVSLFFGAYALILPQPKTAHA